MRQLSPKISLDLNPTQLFVVAGTEIGLQLVKLLGLLPHLPLQVTQELFQLLVFVNFTRETSLGTLRVFPESCLGGAEVVQLTASSLQFLVQLLTPDLLYLQLPSCNSQYEVRGQKKNMYNKIQNMGWGF